MLPLLPRMGPLLPTIIKDMRKVSLRSTREIHAIAIAGAMVTRRRTRPQPSLPPLPFALSGASCRGAMATLPAGRAASTNDSGSEDNISTINPPKKGDLVVNKAIQARTVRLVVKNDAGGPASSSILSRDEALAKAQLAGLDLVLVTAASDPWVCKLADAKREKYQRVKKEKKTKNIGSVLKEISIRGNISDHDLLIKLRRVMGFFEHGYSVRIIIVPTGHQLSLRPGRLQEIYDFILKDYLVDKYKGFVEIKPSPGSLRREMIVHPKRNASGGGGEGGGASKGAPKRTGNQKRDRKVEINKESRRENENGAKD